MISYRLFPIIANIQYYRDILVLIPLLRTKKDPAKMTSSSHGQGQPAFARKIRKGPEGRDKVKKTNLTYNDTGAG